MGDTVTPFSGADGNGNGVIDQGDCVVWRAHFGQTIGAGSHPEGTQQGAGSGISTAGALTATVAHASQPKALPGVTTPLSAESVPTTALRRSPPATVLGCYPRPCRRLSRILR